MQIFKKAVEFIGAVIVGWVAIISYAKLHIVVRTILLVLAGSFMISLIAGINVVFTEGEL